MVKSFVGLLAGLTSVQSSTEASAPPNRVLDDAYLNAVFRDQTSGKILTDEQFLKKLVDHLNVNVTFGMINSRASANPLETMRYFVDVGAQEYFLKQFIRRIKWRESMTEQKILEIRGNSCVDESLRKFSTFCHYRRTLDQVLDATPELDPCPDQRRFAENIFDPDFRRLICCINALRKFKHNRHCDWGLTNSVKEVLDYCTHDSPELKKSFEHLYDKVATASVIVSAIKIITAEERLDRLAYNPRDDPTAAMKPTDMAEKDQPLD